MFTGVGPTPTLGASVAPSGRSILLVARDGAGKTAGITNFSSPSEVQDITLSPLPAGTSAPAIVLATPGGPGGGGPQNLGFQFVANSPRFVNALGVYQGSGLEGTAGQTIYLADITAGVANAKILAQVVAGSPAATDAFNYFPIAPVQLTAGSSYSVYATFAGSPSAQYEGGTLALDPDFTILSTDGLSQYGGAGSSPPAGPLGNALLTASFLHGSTANATDPSLVLSYMGQSTAPIPLVAEGSATVIPGGPATLLAALESLAAIGPGGVAVTQGFDASTYRVTWPDLSPHPLISGPAGVASVVEVVKGGAGITLTRNGGSPMALDSWVWGSWGGSGPPQTQGSGSEVPHALCPLFQSAPALQTFKVNQIPFVGGGEDGEFLDVGALSVSVPFAYTAGKALTFLLDGLPAGTFAPAITWRTAITYQFAPFIPCTATRVEIQVIQDGVAGASSTVTVNQSLAPSGYQDQSGRWWASLTPVTLTGRVNTIKVMVTTLGIAPAASGQPQPAVNLDGLQLSRTSADQSVVIQPGDVVTLDIPAGLITTTAGAIPAIPNLSCPCVPTLPAFVAGPKTTKVGLNISVQTYYTTQACQANLATSIDLDGAVLDPVTGCPVKLRTSSTNGVINLPAGLDCLVSASGGSASLGDPREGTASLANGPFTLFWDGDISISDGDPAVTLISANGYSSTMTVIESNLAGKTTPTGNRVVFQPVYPAGLSAAPYFSIRFRSSTPDPSDTTGTLCLINVRNLAIYQGNVATPQQPKFDANFLRKVAGMDSLRFLDPLNINTNGCGSFADYKPASYLDRNNGQGYARQFAPIPVATIQVPQGAWATHYPPMGDRLVFQATTTLPHGLYDGCRVVFSGLKPAQFVGGAADLTQFYQAYAKVIDATNFLVIGQGPQVANGTAMTNVITGGFVTAPFQGTSWPLDDLIDLVLDSGSKGIWFQFCVGMDTSVGGGVDQTIAYLMSRLPAGTKFYIELGNECWNGQFDTNHWCVIENSALTGTFSESSYEAWFVQKTKAVHDRCAAVMTAAGRVGDLVRVLGTKGGGGLDGSVAALFQAASKLGMPVDVACMACYYRNQPAGGTWNQAQMPILHGMTASQLLDYLEANAVHGGYAQHYVTSCYSAIATVPGYANVKVAAYEGSSEVLVAIDPPSASVPPQDSPNFFPRQLAVKRHPRHHDVVLAFLQGYQDAGLSLWNWFHAGSATSDYCWDMYEYGDQPDGTGDPTLDAVNVATPQAKNATLAEAGGAWHRWASLVGPETTTTTVATKLVPGRNGRLGAHGFPRGLDRLVGLR